MPNFQKIYSNAIGRVSLLEREQEQKAKEETKEQIEASARTQIRLDWLQSTITQELFSTIGKQVEDYLAQAELLAISYPSHQNHQQIIHALVKANTLRKVIESYGRSKSH